MNRFRIAKKACEHSPCFILLQYKYITMELKDVFYGIESITEALLLEPMDALRAVELDSWALANVANWLFMLIGFVAMVYWLLQLKKFNENNEEDRTSTSHAFLGKGPYNDQ